MGLSPSPARSESSDIRRNNQLGTTIRKTKTHSYSGSISFGLRFEVNLRRQLIKNEWLTTI